MHYKTIKFNIKIPLNIIQFSFLRRVLRTKFDIATLRAKRAEKFGGIFLTFDPPPPPPNPKNGSTPLTINAVTFYYLWHGAIYDSIMIKHYSLRKNL